MCLWEILALVSGIVFILQLSFEYFYLHNIKIFIKLNKIKYSYETFAIISSILQTALVVLLMYSLSIVNNIWFFVVGVILIAFFTYFSLDTLIRDIGGKRSENFKQSVKHTYYFTCLLEVVVLLYLLIFVVYKIPDTILQSIIASIITAIITGSITLVGVAWTIKSVEKNRKEDFDRAEKEKNELEKKKAKPLFSYLLYTGTDSSDNETLCSFLIEEKYYGRISCIARLKNSDNSNFTISRLFFKGKWYDAGMNNFVLKNQIINIQILCNFVVKHKDNPFCYLEIEDTIGIMHYYKMNFMPMALNNMKINHLESFKEVAKKDMPTECWKENNNVEEQ